MERGMTMETSTLPHLAQFAEVIRTCKDWDVLANPVTRSKLTLSSMMSPRSGKLTEVIYSPFEHIERGAELVIVGITPGKTQANEALRVTRKALIRGADMAAAAREAKLAASFHGDIRKYLCRMLDVAGVNSWMGIQNSLGLFTDITHRVHFTSALRNPVLIGGNDYTGQPKIMTQPVFVRMVESSLAEETRALPNAYWLPLGNGPWSALNHLVSKGDLAANRLLPPLPHPSFQNGELVNWFLGRNRKKEFSRVRLNAGPRMLAHRERLIEFFASPRNLECRVR